MYPMDMELTDRLCVVVGGGQVAARKIKSLLMAGARVNIVAPVLLPELADLAAAGQVMWLAQSYAPAVLPGAFLAFCATDDPAVNRQVVQDAHQQGILVNCAAPAELSDFTVPAHSACGKLHFAVSTEGASPAMAACLCRSLTKEYAALGTFLEHLGRLRRELVGQSGTSRMREHFWRQVLNGPVLELIRQNKLDEAEAELKNAIHGFRTQS